MALTYGVIDKLHWLFYIVSTPGHLLQPGLEISWSWKHRPPLNSPLAPSNLCREPKDVLALRQGIAVT